MGISQCITSPQRPGIPLLCGWQGLQWARGSSPAAGMAGPRQQGSSKGEPAGGSLRLNSRQWSELVRGAWKMLRNFSQDLRPPTGKVGVRMGRAGWERIKGKGTALLNI